MGSADFSQAPGRDAGIAGKWGKGKFWGGKGCEWTVFGPPLPGNPPGRSSVQEKTLP